MVNKGTVLGHKISERGTEVDKAMVDAIEKMPCPKDIKGIHSCWCQNRWISGRGSRTVRLRLMVTGGRGHNVFPGSGLLDGGNTLLPA